MLEAFYYIFIYPICLIIEILFYFFSCFGFPTLFIIFLVSYFINLISLPMYMAADRMQQEERDLQNKMASRVKSIKENFKGAERYMILATYYRQNHYHPIMALRKSLSVAIQIPFFMAAYLFFSHLEILNGASLGPIKNLGLPDGLLIIGNLKINILPILMTVINIFSAQIYAKNLKAKDKVQLYALPLIFLVLLYQSPAGLVLYWTFNQLISLIRNIILRLKNSKNVFLTLNLVIITVILLQMGVGYVTKTIETVIMTCLLLLMLVGPIYAYIDKFKEYKKENLDKKEKYLFFLTCLTNCICLGLLIPSNLFVSSPSSFPLSLLFCILVQSIGLFIMLPCALYFFTNNAFKKFLLLFSVLFLFMSVVNILNTGAPVQISNYFVFTHSNYISNVHIAVNFLVCLITSSFVAVLFDKKYTNFTLQLVTIVCISALGLSAVNSYKLFKFYRKTKIEQEDNMNPKIHLSKKGKNVIVLMMDRSVNSFLPMIFEEKPELLDIYTGFTYYPNTVSYYSHTILGLPPILGGYEYIPEEINKRPERVVYKYNEALLVLPTIFKNNNFNTLMVDVAWPDFKEDMSGDLFKRNNIGWANLEGRYIEHYLTEFEGIRPLLEDNQVVQKRQSFMYSVYRSIPALFKDLIYNKGNYLSMQNELKIPDMVLKSYSAMYFLPKLTDFTSDKDTFTFIESNLPHSESLLEYPSYTLTGKFIAGDNWDGDLYSHKSYHLNVASLLLIGKFINYLKENDVYDNTRIIIVSDHGGLFVSNTNKSEFFNKITEPFNPILFVKDFNAKGKYKTDYTFMTNGDVPFISLKGIENNPINPFTNKKMTADKKKDGVVFFVEYVKWNPSHFPGVRVFENSSYFIKVKDNIFEGKNYILDYKYD